MTVGIQLAARAEHNYDVSIRAKLQESKIQKKNLSPTGEFQARNIDMLRQSFSNQRATNQRAILNLKSIREKRVETDRVLSNLLSELSNIGNAKKTENAPYNRCSTYNRLMHELQGQNAYSFLDIEKFKEIVSIEKSADTASAPDSLKKLTGDIGTTIASLTTTLPAFGALAGDLSLHKALSKQNPNLAEIELLLKPILDNNKTLFADDTAKPEAAPALAGALLAIYDAQGSENIEKAMLGGNGEKDRFGNGVTVSLGGNSYTVFIFESSIMVQKGIDSTQEKDVLTLDTDGMTDLFRNAASASLLAYSGKDQVVNFVQTNWHNAYSATGKVASWNDITSCYNLLQNLNKNGSVLNQSFSDFDKNQCQVYKQEEMYCSVVFLHSKLIENQSMNKLLYISSEQPTQPAETRVYMQSFSDYRNSIVTNVFQDHEVYGMVVDTTNVSSDFQKLSNDEQTAFNLEGIFDKTNQIVDQKRYDNLKRAIQTLQERNNSKIDVLDGQIESLQRDIVLSHSVSEINESMKESLEDLGSEKPSLEVEALLSEKNNSAQIIQLTRELKMSENIKGMQAISKMLSELERNNAGAAAAA